MTKKSTRTKPSYTVETRGEIRGKYGVTRSYAVIEERTKQTMRWFLSETEAEVYAAYLNAGGNPNCTPKGVCR